MNLSNCICLDDVKNMTLMYWSQLNEFNTYYDITGWGFEYLVIFKTWLTLILYCVILLMTFVVSFLCLFLLSVGAWVVALFCFKEKNHWITRIIAILLTIMIVIVAKLIPSAKLLEKIDHTYVIMGGNNDRLDSTR